MGLVYQAGYFHLPRIGNEIFSQPDHFLLVRGELVVVVVVGDLLKRVQRIAEFIGRCAGEGHVVVQRCGQLFTCQGRRRCGGCIDVCRRRRGGGRYASRQGQRTCGRAHADHELASIEKDLFGGNLFTRNGYHCRILPLPSE